MYGPNTQRILVVDDESALGRAMQIALTMNDWDVVCCHGGDEAHARLHNEHFDALVVDLLMPDMRGDVFFYIATSIQPHLAKATLFVTGDITKHADDLIEACGCTFLRKPFDLNDLVGEMRKLLDDDAQRRA